MQRCILIIPLIHCALVTGCAVFGPQLQEIVTDSVGVPIAGAAVYPVTPSMSGAPRYTDDTGKATIPLNQIQDVQWVSVVSQGFASQQVRVPSDSPPSHRIVSEFS